MKTSFTLSFTLFLFLFIGCSPKERIKQSTEPSMRAVVLDALDFATRQTKLMAKSLADQPGKLPQTTDRFGNLVTCESAWWVSGFFPGQLWYLYEYTKDPELLDYAKEFLTRVEKEQYTTDNHDVGFMIFCSFGNAYRITGDTAYLSVIETASKSLSTRYHEKIGCIQSWGSNDRWKYPVIIDNMMNLELLMWSAEQFNNDSFKEIAVTHANTTIEHHFRPDFSTFHVVSYDPETGLPHVKNTAQGYADESAWARGQSWGFYGYVMMYRMTGDEKYLTQAESIARYLLNHENLPADKIPYWDFNAPNIPDCSRDASAGAIMCSALIELSELTTDKALSETALSVAETQLRNLNSPSYRNAMGNNGNFILKYSVGHMPANTEVDKPLSYADYYFVEALMRYKTLKGF